MFLAIFGLMVLSCTKDNINKSIVPDLTKNVIGLYTGYIKTSEGTLYNQQIIISKISNDSIQVNPYIGGENYCPVPVFVSSLLKQDTFLFLFIAPQIVTYFDTISGEINISPYNYKANGYYQNKSILFALKYNIVYNFQTIKCYLIFNGKKQ